MLNLESIILCLNTWGGKVLFRMIHWYLLPTVHCSSCHDPRVTNDNIHTTMVVLFFPNHFYVLLPLYWFKLDKLHNGPTFLEKSCLLARKQCLKLLKIYMVCLYYLNFLENLELVMLCAEQSYFKCWNVRRRTMCSLVW